MFSFLLQNEYLGTILAPPRQGPSLGELKLLLKAGKLTEAQELLDAQSNVPLSDNESIDDLSKDGLNVLHVACAANAVAIVIELVNTRGAKVNVQSSSGNTPLHYAAVNGHGNLVDVLLRYGADQSLPNHAGEIAADLWTGGKGSALLQNRSEVTDRMLSPTALFHKRTLELNSSVGGGASSPSVISPARLHQQVLSAAQETAEAMSEELSYRNYSKLVFKKIEEQPPDLSTIRALLRRDPSLALSRTAGSDLFGIGFNDGFTPLHAAAFYGHCDVIALLLEHDRVNAWVRDLQGKTPLHIAAERGHAAACQHLREAMKTHSGGVDPVGTDAPLDLSGRTPMGCFSKTETVTKDKQLAMRAVIFSPGDRSVLPRSPVPERSGCSPWRLPASRSPLPGQRQGQEQGQGQGQEHQFVYAFSEACGFKRQMEDQIVLRCPLEPVTFPSWSIFGVCDGHGGSACSKYLARRFPTVLEWAASQAPSSSSSSSSTSSSSSSVGAAPAHESKDSPDTLRHVLSAACAAIEAEMRTSPAFHIDVYRRHEDSGQPSLVSFLDSAASGSTGIFCLATLQHLAVANVGDSRAVLAQFGGPRAPAPPSDDALVSPRPGEGSAGGHNLVAVPLSRDHKLGVAEQERAVKAGATIIEGQVPRLTLPKTKIVLAPTENEGRFVQSTAASSVFDRCQLAVGRAFGDFIFKQRVAASSLTGESGSGRDDDDKPLQALTAEPDIDVRPRSPADAFLVLASDGIFDVLTDQQVVDFLGAKMGYTTSGPPPAVSVEDLVEACDALVQRCLDLYSADNMSVVVVVLGGASGEAVGGASRPPSHAVGAATPTHTPRQPILTPSSGTANATPVATTLTRVFEEGHALGDSLTAESVSRRLDQVFE